MSSHLKLVATREYLRQVKNPIFWISTLALPFFVVIINVIVIVSNQSVKETEKRSVEQSKIVIIDEAGLIQLPAKDTITKSADKQNEITKVEQGQLDAVVVFPKDIIDTKKVEIYQKDTGLGTRDRFNSFADDLLKSSILARINDPKLIGLYQSQLQKDIKSYGESNQPAIDFSSVVLPAAIGALYLFLIMFSASSLLNSVSEEKENRAMELVLTSVTPRQLIWGKILGISLSGVTQLIVIGSLAAVAVTIFASNQTSFLSSALGATDPLKVLFAFGVVVTGYLMIGCLMAAVGALAPSAKDAGGLSGVVMFGSFFPLYFLSSIIAQPTSNLAYITSYFPLTSPIILLLRNAIGAIPPWEMALAIAVLIIYVILALLIATKAFQLGALEYGNKVSLSKLFKRRV